MRMRECLTSGGIASNSSSPASVKKILPYSSKSICGVWAQLCERNVLPQRSRMYGRKDGKEGNRACSPLEQTLRVSSYVGRNT